MLQKLTIYILCFRNPGIRVTAFCIFLLPISAPQILCNGVWDDFLYCKIGQRLLIFSYKNVDICDFSDKTRFFTRKCQFHYLGHIQILKFWLHYKQTTQRSGQRSQWLNYYIVFAVFPLNRAFYPPSDRSIIWGLIKKNQKRKFRGIGVHGTQTDDPSHKDLVTVTIFL